MGGGICEPALGEALIVGETPSLATGMVAHPVLIEIHLSSERCAATPICATPAMASARAVGLSTFGAFRNGHTIPNWTGWVGGWVLRPSLPCPEILGIGATHGMRTGCVPCLCPTCPQCMGPYMAWTWACTYTPYPMHTMAMSTLHIHVHAVHMNVPCHCVSHECKQCNNECTHNPE